MNNIIESCYTPEEEKFYSDYIRALCEKKNKTAEEIVYLKDLMNKLLQELKIRKIDPKLYERNTCFD